MGFVNKTIPTAFENSMSYYDTLCVLYNYLQNEILPATNENIELTKQLKEYVEHYFDNLDVQEEINNKLDEMADSGELADIIAAYIQLKGILAYDTVADLKNATNIVDGSFVETYGWTTKGDGGGAKYKIRTITNDDTINDSTIIEITADPSDTLVAELIINPVMNVKQFGCKGDNSTDDTAKLTIAMSTCSDLIIPSGDYIVSRFLPNDNQTIIGEGYPTIKTNGEAPQVVMNDNNVIKGVKFKSTSESLEWNRCMIDQVSNITLERCSFEDFKHASGSPNAWGILLAKCKNIVIEGCYFDGNSQSDIALIEGCNNVTIDNCDGPALHINIEPNNSNYPLENIKITNTNIDRLDCQENDYTGDSTKSLLVTNCKIAKLVYDGSSSIFENCLISDIDNTPVSNIIYGGKLELINSLNLTANLLEDPYLDAYENNESSTQPWFKHYLTSLFGDSITSVKDENGIQFVLNYQNTSSSTIIKHQDLTVTAGDKYVLRVNSKCNYPSTAIYVSLNFVVRWINDSNEQVSQQIISMNRGKTNTVTPFQEQSAVLKVPTGATKLRLFVFSGANASGTSITATQSIFLRSVELFKVNATSTPNTIPKLPIRENRVFKSATTVGTSNYNKYYTGDVMYFKTPSTYIGQVATADGYGNNATWKNFGALES